jgi:undecaprenyl-diphosphatase
MAGRRRHLLGLEVEVLIGFIVLTFLIALFVLIASDMAEGDTLAWDRAILRRMRSAEMPLSPVGPLWLRKWMVDITTLGGGPFLTLLTAIIAGFLFVTRRPAMALFLVASTAGGGMAGAFLKNYFVRERPDVVPHLVEVQSMSFPSAHAFNSAVIYLTLGALLARAETRRPVRLYIICTALFLTVVIGISRVYLGVHYPSDVLAGWCAGAAWAAGCAFVARSLQRQHKLEHSEANESLHASPPPDRPDG